MRRLASAGVLLGCLAAIVTVVARRSGSERAGLCAGGAARLSRSWGTSGASSPRRDAIERAFVATGQGFAARAFTSAARYLDEYVGQWLGTYREACEATHVRGEQSTEVLDLRMACLNERLVELQALTDEFAKANAKVVENAVAGVSGLGRIDRCSDVAVLRAVVKPPSDEATRRRVTELAERKARLSALGLSGKCDEGRALARELIPLIRETHYGPLLAETLLMDARLEDACGSGSDVLLPVEREGFVVALASGHDEVAGEMASYIGARLADRERQLTAARQWIAISRAIVARIGGVPTIEAAVDQATGIVYLYEGNEGASLRAFDRGIATNQRVRGPDHPYVGLLLSGKGQTYQIVGKHEQAVEVTERAEVLFRRVVGPEHPWVAMTLANKAESLNALHRYSEARRAFEEALRLWSKQGGAPVILAYAQTGLGIALIGEGRPREAISPLEHALEARVRAQTPPDLVGETRFALARALWPQSETRARALSLAQLARREYAAAEAGKETAAAIDAWLKAPPAKL